VNLQYTRRWRMQMSLWENHHIFELCHVIKISKIFGDFVPRDPAFTKVFSRRATILKIVKTLGTRLTRLLAICFSLVGYEARPFSLKGNGTRHGRSRHKKKIFFLVSPSSLLGHTAPVLPSSLLSHHHITLLC